MKDHAAETARFTFCKGCPCANFAICEMRKIPGWMAEFKKRKAVIDEADKYK
ncbi:MAG TPA: hypothetical protein VLM20_08190 [Methylophilaceae bacterium]|nr:hypothetical protein [Methylophilaceae bacterium]